MSTFFLCKDEILVKKTPNSLHEKKTVWRQWTLILIFCVDVHMGLDLPPSTCVHLSLTPLPSLRVDVINGWPQRVQYALPRVFCRLITCLALMWHLHVNVCQAKSYSQVGLLFSCLYLKQNCNLTFMKCNLRNSSEALLTQTSEGTN